MRHHLTVKKTLALAVTLGSLMLSGCAAKVGGQFADDANASVVTDEAVNAQLGEMTSSWNATPGIQLLQHRNGEGISIHGPVDVPSRIGNQQVSLAFNGAITINDLAEALALEGINLIPVDAHSGAASAPVPTAGDDAPAVDSPDEQLVSALQGAVPTIRSSASADSVGNKVFRLPRFNGSVKELLEVVSMMTDVSFRGQGSYVLARNGIEYYVDLPQDSELVSRVVQDLQALGAQNVATSVDAGSVTFSAGASRDHVLRDYMKRLERNNAMIGLQVAVLSVSHDRDRNTGIDWSALQATIGGGNASLSNNGSNSDGSNSDGSNGDTGTASDGDNGMDGAMAAVANGVNRLSGVADGSGLSLSYLSRDFELRGLINILSRYGTTETKQNLVLRTLSANPVRIRSGQSTPYVSEINVSSARNTLTGGTKTEVAETGLTLDITPYYNDKTGLVTMNVDLDMSSIIAFINLSAGNQIGALTQPDIQEQSFSNAARLLAGETVILGGITYDQVSYDGNTLTPIESLQLDGEQYSRQQNSLFVVLRPTVTIYE